MTAGSPDVFSSSLDADLPLPPVYEVLSMISPSVPLLWRNIHRSQRGMSLIELLVTIGIISVLIALTIPQLNQSTLNLPIAEQNLIADIRMTRASATTRGARFKVSLASDSYSIRRLQDDDNDGEWEPDGAFPTQTVNFPSSITITEGADAEIEFTTRGLLADQPDGTPAAIVTISLHDSHKGETRTVEVWPSGQIEEV